MLKGYIWIVSVVYTWDLVTFELQLGLSEIIIMTLLQLFGPVVNANCIFYLTNTNDEMELLGKHKKKTVTNFRNERVGCRAIFFRRWKAPARGSHINYRGLKCPKVSTPR